jgi:hypothetical protein
MTDREWKADGSIEDILRYFARADNVFDSSKDTVIVTRPCLTIAADEIERLRAALRDLLFSLSLYDEWAVSDEYKKAELAAYEQ